MNGISLKFRATDEQVQTFEARCAMTEWLFAQTLAKRIEGLSAKESEPFIRDWFSSVRHMAIANHITSGIVVESEVIGSEAKR